MVKKVKTAELKRYKIIVTIFFLLIVSLFTIWFTKTYIGINSEAVFISLILIPIILYLILTGQLKELRAPGGWAIMIEELAKEQIKTLTFANEKITKIEVQNVAGRSYDELYALLLKIKEDKPLILTLVVGTEGYYDRNQISEYLMKLFNFPNFKFIVFTDKREKFLAFTTKTNLQHILEFEEYRTSIGHEISDKFIKMLNSGDKELFQFDRIITDAVSEKSTYSDALSMMSKYHLDAFIVIDMYGNITGIIERSHIVNKIMAAILESG